MYVMWEMTWLFLYLFPLMVVESLGDFWRPILRVVLAGVCRRTWYRLWFAWFLLVLVILLYVWFHLHWIWDWLEIVITSLCSCMSYERWHSYSFISFLYWLWRTWESIGDLLWELFLQVICLCVVDVPWDYMDSHLWDAVSGLVIDLTSLLQWELLSIYVVGISLKACDCRL